MNLENIKTTFQNVLKMCKNHVTLLLDTKTEWCKLNEVLSIVYVKASTTNNLKGFGGPRVLKSDPACIFHHS